MMSEMRRATWSGLDGRLVLRREYHVIHPPMVADDARDLVAPPLPEPPTVTLAVVSPPSRR